METIRVRINADGVTAREWNPLGEKPPQKVKTSFSKIDNFYNSKMESKWQQAEAALRTFEIDLEQSAIHTHGEEILKTMKPIAFTPRYIQNNGMTNNIRTAEILLNGKIKILNR